MISLSVKCVPVLYVTEEGSDIGEVFIAGKDFNNGDHAIEILKNLGL